MEESSSALLRIGDEELLVVRLAPGARLPPELTAAELEVAQLACAGLSNAAIAERRGTTPRTAANQLGRVFEKLGVSSRVELQARFGP